MGENLEVVVNPGQYVEGTFNGKRVEALPGMKFTTNKKEAERLRAAGAVSYADEVDAAEAAKAATEVIVLGSGEHEKVVKALKEALEKLEELQCVASENEVLRLEIEKLSNENDELLAKVETRSSTATEEAPDADRQRVMEIMKAMIEADEGCGPDKVPNVKELNAKLKEAGVDLKVDGKLRDELMAEINGGQ